MIVIREIHLSDIIVIYKDPETEKDPEGYAFVWDIQEIGEEFYTLIVSFMSDPRKRKVPRKYRRKDI